MWSGDSKQLENFDESIAGKASLFIQTQGLHPFWYVAAGTPPFQRKFLITSTVGLHQEFDVVFRPREPIDYSLILSYALNAPGPVYIQSEIELPEQFINTLYTSKNRSGLAPTLVTMLPTFPRLIKPYTSLFFTPIKDHTSQETGALITFLRTHSILNISEDELRAYIKELRVTGGGVVWSRINTAGVIYWYDPADCQPPAPTPASKAVIQRSVAQGLLQLQQQLQLTLI
jgi:hypothetical protein